MVRTHPGHPRYHQPAVEAVPLINCMELQLRFLSPADIDQVRHAPLGHRKYIIIYSQGQVSVSGLVPY